MLIPSEAAAEMLAQRDDFRPGSMDWEWRNCTAWTFFQMGQGIAPNDWTAPPADFGPQYLQPQFEVAAE